jgi:hypothetical protein
LYVVCRDSGANTNAKTHRDFWWSDITSDSRRRLCEKIRHLRLLGGGGGGRGREHYMQGVQCSAVLCDRREATCARFRTFPCKARHSSLVHVPLLQHVSLLSCVRSSPVSCTYTSYETRTVHPPLPVLLSLVVAFLGFWLCGFRVGAINPTIGQNFLQFIPINTRTVSPGSSASN